MEKRINREIEEKRGLLQDIEETVDLKIFPLTHHKNPIVFIKDYSLRYEDSLRPLFKGSYFYT